MSGPSVTTREAAPAVFTQRARQNTATYICGGFAVRASADIAAFASSWPALSDNAAAHAFQRRDHLEIWMETIGAGLRVRPIFISVTNKSGAPVMLLPLGVTRKHGVKVLGFLDGGVADYNAPVLFPAAGKLERADVVQIWKTICRAARPFDVAELEKMPEHAGRIANPLYKLAQYRWQHSGHVLALQGSGELTSARELKESRRKRRRIAALGELSFGIAASESEIAEIYNIFVRQKSRRYRETLGHDGFDVPGQKAYYLTLTERLSHAQLAYLQCGDEIIATAWSLIAGKRVYYLMAGYEDGKWRTHSPGWLLLEELVNWSLKNGIEIFDFGIGDEAYKMKWQEHELVLMGATFPETPLGWLAYGASNLYAAAKRAVPPGLKASIKAFLGGRVLPS